MDDIIFRAWDKQLKEMLPNVQNHIGGGEWAFGNMLNDDRYIVMQYTGLSDVNDKMIFERDIVSIGVVNKTVEFITGCFCVKDVYGSTNPLYEDSEYVVVVGNELENANLLG